MAESNTHIITSDEHARWLIVYELALGRTMDPYAASGIAEQDMKVIRGYRARPVKSQTGESGRDIAINLCRGLLQAENRGDIGDEVLAALKRLGFVVVEAEGSEGWWDDVEAVLGPSD